MKALAVEQHKTSKIFDDLKKQIESSVFKEGDRLPTEAQLTEIYNCSRPTVSKSLNRLQDLKLVQRVKGSGTYVSKKISKKNPLRNVGVLIRTNLNDDDLASDYYFGQIIVGLQRDYGSNRCNFNVLVMNYEENMETFFNRSGVSLDDFDGLICLSVNLTEKAIALLNKKSIPFVETSPSAGREHISYVTLDNAWGIYKATDHLLSLGRKDLRLLNGPISHVINKKRLDGFQRALRENNIEYNDDMYVEVSLSNRDSVQKVVGEMCENRDKSSFDGLIVCREPYAVFSTLQEQGVRIPEDVAFIMYDDIPWVQKILGNSVTSVKQPFVDQAKHMLRILINKIDGQEKAIVIEILQPELIIRKSCGSALNHNI